MVKRYLNIFHNTFIFVGNLGGDIDIWRICPVGKFVWGFALCCGDLSCGDLPCGELAGHRVCNTSCYFNTIMVDTAYCVRGSLAIS